VTPDEARDFVAKNHRAVLVTRGSDGGVQTSPVLVGIDAEGKAVISSRETTYKVRNLRWRPIANLCVMNDGFYGGWVWVEGETEIVSMPEALDGLIDYYRRISGEHPDWDDDRRAMSQDRRVLLRVSFDRVGPTRFG
jgi:PPOX class probable F420-dependent enzyme